MCSRADFAAGRPFISRSAASGRDSVCSFQTLVCFVVFFVRIHITNHSLFAVQFSNARNALRQRRICSASRMKHIPFFLCGNRTASELQPLEQPTVPSSRIDVLQRRNAACTNSPDAPDAPFECLLIRAVQAAKRSLSCSKPVIAARITPLTASRVISRPVHLRYSRVIRMTKRSLSCLKPASEPTGSPRHALERLLIRAVQATKRSLSCLKPAKIARASSSNASQTICRACIAHPCPSSVHGLQSPLSASSSPISPS